MNAGRLFRKLLALLIQNGEAKIKKYGRRLEIAGVATTNKDGMMNDAPFRALLQPDEWLANVYEPAPKGSPYTFDIVFYAVPKSKRAEVHG